MATKAYSYVRFSSLKQRHGASENRQLEAATKYAHTHDLLLDTSTFKDLGVSAFRSKNAEGALGAFLDAVKSGKIAQGSYLLIESLDRLSRDNVDTALELFLGITRKGIVIVTLMDGVVYSSATIRENWTKLVIALAVMARANEESATKSSRAHDAHQRRAERGEIPTTRLPTWMKFSTDRKSAVLIPARARIVKRIFDDVINGQGSRQIARDLNAGGVPVLFYATEWRQSAVSQLIKNPAMATRSDMHDWLFVGQRGQMTHGYFGKLVRQWFVDAGIEARNVACHSLRKTFVRLNHEVFGVSLGTLMITLNHSTERQTLAYCGLTAADVEKTYANVI